MGGIENVLADPREIDADPARKEAEAVSEQTDLIPYDCELIQIAKIEDGKIFLGGYWKYYDWSGNLVRVTKPEYTCSLEWT